MKECSMSLVIVRAFLLHILGCCWHEHVEESVVRICGKPGAADATLGASGHQLPKDLNQELVDSWVLVVGSHLEEPGMDTRTPILSGATLHGLCHLAALLGRVEGPPLVEALLAAGTGWRRSSSPAARAVPQGLPHDCTHRVIWIGI